MRFLTGLMCLAVSCSATAGLTVNGRLADVQHLPRQSIEGKVEIASGGSNLTSIGGRFNYKYSNKLLLTGTLASLSDNSGDTTLVSVSGQYVIDDVLRTMDLASFASLGTLSGDADGNLWTLGLVTNSRKPFGANNNIFWYGNVFISRISDNGRGDNDIGIGGGLVMPTPTGEFFGGIDLIDDPIIGLGFRYFMK